VLSVRAIVATFAVREAVEFVLLRTYPADSPLHLLLTDFSE
jgi:hypothetical protein